MKQMTKSLLCFFTLIILTAPALAQRTAEEYLKASYARLKTRDLDGAIAALDKAIELNPNFAQAYLQRSRLLVMKGATDASLADLDKAILINPDFTDAYPERARLRMMKNDAAGALSDLDNAIVRGYRSDTIYSQRVSLRMATGNVKGALADADTAISLNPDRIGHYLARGAVKDATGDIDGALSDYNYIIDRFEKREAERLAEGKSERTAEPFDLTSPVISGPERAVSKDMNKDSQSVQGVTKVEGQTVMKLDTGRPRTPEQMEYLPNVAGAYLNRAQIHNKKGDVKAALAGYSKSIKINPFFGTYHGRAMLLRKTGVLSSALADFTKVIEIRPDMAIFYVERGVTYVLMNRDAEAEKDFATALSMNPGLQPTIQTRRDEAKKQLEKKP
jgi:tetratricopeptide (TPR) repeat protein